MIVGSGAPGGWEGIGPAKAADGAGAEVDAMAAAVAVFANWKGPLLMTRHAANMSVICFLIVRLLLWLTYALSIDINRGRCHTSKDTFGG
jgi:hypothetical protein